MALNHLAVLMFSTFTPNRRSAQILKFSSEAILIFTGRSDIWNLFLTPLISVNGGRTDQQTQYT